MKTVAIVLSLGLLLSCEHAAPASAPYKDISVEEFAELMKNGNAVVIDVRTPPEIAAGKIAGALEMDYYATDFCQQLSALDPAKTYLIYCRSGRRSGEACEMLHAMGFDTLYNLEDGYLAWAPKQME